MAEVFSHLMYGNLPEEIDPILKKKIEFIKKGISKIDKNFILWLRKLKHQHQKKLYLSLF